MKKYLSLILSIVLAISLTACDNSEEETESEVVTTTSTSDTPIELAYASYDDEVVCGECLYTRKDTDFCETIAWHTISWGAEKKMCTPRFMSDINNPGDFYVRLVYTDQDTLENIAVGAIIVSPGETVTFPTISERLPYAIDGQAVSVEGNYTFTIDW